MTYARRRDVAHADIVAALRRCGFGVVDLAGVGKGVPDLLISKGGRCALVELKTPKGRKTAEDRLRVAQKEFREGWKGPAIIVAFDLKTILFDWGLITKRWLT